MGKNYLEIARKYIYETEGDEFDVSEESIENYEDIFCFFYQSKKYLETLDFRDMLVGQGPQLIIKSDDRIIPFGSAYTSDTAIRETRKKILIENTIRKVCPNYNYWHDNYVLIIIKKLKYIIFFTAELVVQIDLCSNLVGFYKIKFFRHNCYVMPCFWVFSRLR